MCGLTGFLTLHSSHPDHAALVVKRMAETLAHRGPDDAGSWLDPAAGIALAQRRLAIIDLSPTGHQPMVSPSGRYVLVFNGEIYNHLEIRRKLEASWEQDLAWRGTSDTETLVVAIERWGLQATLKMAVGMFALGLWDRQERVLSLARDRLGEKPLYYGWQGEAFLFGSELKALREHPAFRGEINRDVLPVYLRFGYIPAPWSIWCGIFKLIPGTILYIQAGSVGNLPKPEPYWSLAEVAATSQAHLFTGSDDEALAILETKLREAVRDQMVADVPLGAFLSGGIDSSTIVALMQTQSRLPVKTFTIGFAEQQYNEADYARIVARHLGTDHTELYLTSQEAMEIIPKIPTLYDEPYGDTSAIPTFLVSQLARSQVTVALSGDGGDELFCGYERYQRAKRAWEISRRIPRLARPVAAYAITHLLGKSNNEHIVRVLQCNNDVEFYQIKTWLPSESLIKHVQQLLSTQPDDWTGFTYTTSMYERMMYTDMLTYLPDDILVKVDRAAMAHSLETRIPLLDHRVVEFACTLPLAMKLRDGTSKWLLRHLLYKYIPKELVERPKMGFGIPLDHWMCGALRGWIEDLLSEERLSNDGFFDPKLLRNRWQQYLAGDKKLCYSLWYIIMFEAWLDQL